jgi:hypothetical protein
VNDGRRLLALVLAVMGCTVALLAWLAVTHQDDNASFVPVPQQNALGQLAEDFGYEIYGIPFYSSEIRRWTINVRVPGCTAKVLLGGNPGPIVVARSDQSGRYRWRQSLT